MSVIDKRRKCFLWFPIKTAKYEIVKNFSDELELVVNKGVLFKKINKTKLYKVNDISYSRSFGNLLFGVGCISIYSTDASNNVECISKIRKPKKFMITLEKGIAEERKRLNISYKESNILK